MNLRKVRENIKYKNKIQSNNCSMIKECMELGETKKNSKRQRYTSLGLIKSMGFQIYEE